MVIAPPRVFGQSCPNLALAGAGCTNTITYSPAAGVWHQAAILADPAGEQTALFDLTSGGALASLTYGGTQYLFSQTGSDFVQPSLTSGAFAPRQAGDDDVGSPVLGVQCAPGILWLTTGLVDGGHNASGRSPAFVVQGSQLVFSSFVSHLTLTTYAYFVPNPAGSPAYYLRIDQTITNLSNAPVSFAFDLISTLQPQFSVAAQSPSNCTDATPCAAASTSSVTAGAYSTSALTTGLALSTAPATYWPADGTVSVQRVISTSSSRTALHTSSLQFNALQARTYGMLVMVGSWANAASYAATPCTVSVASPPDQHVINTGRTGTISVTATAGCHWRASSDAAWISIGSGGSGTGSGIVTYAVDANSDTAVRGGHLVIAGLEYPLFQDRACVFSLDSTSATIASSGGAGAFNVNPDQLNPAGCSWTATSNASFITITSGSSGSGAGQVSYSLAANTGGTRIGTITAAGLTFTVTQEGVRRRTARSLSEASPGASKAGVAMNITVTALDGNSGVITDYDGSVSFASSDSLATLPATYTFVPSDSGVHTFTVILRSTGTQTVTSSEVGGTAAGSASIAVDPLPAPTNLLAIFSGSTVEVSWNPVSGATGYALYRFASLSAPSSMPLVTLSANVTNYSDAQVGVGLAQSGSLGQTYLYAVRTLANNSSSSLSNIDYACTYNFTDPVISRYVTRIKGVHVSELRFAIDSLRQALGLARVWTSYQPLTGVILSDHFLSTATGLRPALNGARGVLQLPAWSFTYSDLPQSLIHLEDITQLRGALR